MPSAMVTFNGRITLPTHVRKQLGLKIGDNVEFVEIEKGRFAIIPGAESMMDLERMPRLNETDEDALEADSEVNCAGAGRP